MSEAYWFGESSVHRDVDITWCVTCDEERDEVLLCEKCGNECCYYCSAGEDTGEPISCESCIEGGNA